MRQLIITAVLGVDKRYKPVIFTTIKANYLSQNSTSCITGVSGFFGYKSVCEMSEGHYNSTYHYIITFSQSK